MDNETLCIHRLPAELLADIFSLSLLLEQPFGCSLRITRAYHLSKTCKIWKAIIEGCPRLWTFVTPLDGPFLVAKAMALSTPRPIHISCPAYLPQNPQWFLELITPHMRRWHSAVLTPPTSYSFLQIPWRRPVKDSPVKPEHDGDRRTDKSGPSYSASEQHPNLAIPVMQWNSGRLSELKTLELHFSSNRPPHTNPTVSDILAILSNCPRLQILAHHLMVTDYEMEWAATERDPNFPIIDLSALQHFSLTAPPTYSASLLSGIALPTAAALALCCCGGESSDLETWLSSVQPVLQASIDRQVNSRFMMDVHLQYKEVIFQFRALTFDGEQVGYRNVFSISFVKASVADAIDAMGTVLQDLNIDIDHTKLLAEWMQDALHQGTLAAIDELPRVTSMVFEGCDVEWLLQVLAKGNGFDLYQDQETHCAFPQLDELEMRRCIFGPRYMLRMVEGRFGSRQRSNGGTEAPVWFKKVRIFGRPDEPWAVVDDPPRWMLRDIRAVLGNGVLEWEVFDEDGSDHEGDRS